MSKIFVVGSINMDAVIKTDRIPDSGETYLGNDFITNPGGKGANQAVAVSKLGGTSIMVGMVGGEFGDKLREALTKYGVDNNFVETDENISSGVAVIIVVGGDNRIILDSGANKLVDEKLVDKALENAKDGDYLICQLEIPLKTVEYAFKKAKSKGMITVLNPAPAKKLNKDILSNCDYFIPNQAESEFYTDIYPTDEASSFACAKKLEEFGVGKVVITMGKDGSCAVVDGRYYKIDAEKVDVVDTTAAGDTYVGAFVVKLAQGYSMEKAMSFASKASAVTVTRNGAQQAIPFLGEIDDKCKNCEKH